MQTPPTRLRKALAAALLSVGLVGVSATPAAGCLQTALAAQPAFSGTALLRQGGRLHVAAQGQADTAGTALRSDARLNMGSASKMFTAVAVAQLVAQGKLAWDAPVGRWVDGLAPPVAAVTLRQLLMHSGGLGNFMVPDNLAALQQARTLEQQLRLVRDVAPQFEPGSRFRYSNTGFLLLGRAVEQAAGKPFAAVLQEQVFDRAGMAHTSLDPALPEPAATGFTRLPEWTPGQGPVQGPGPSGPLRPAAEAALPGTPAGSAYSTVEDLARFMDALHNGKLLGAAWVAELTRAHIDASPPGVPQPLRYGLGFGLSLWEGHRSIGHNGGAPGVNAEVTGFPDDDLLIVVLANRDPPTAAQLHAHLRRGALQGGLCR